MKNKTILVTGGTAGIGYQVASELKALGANVFITGRNNTKLDNVSNELGVSAYHCDSGKPEDIQALAETLKKQDVTLDGLVLNAGVFFPKPMGEVDVDDFNHTFAINTFGPYLTLQALLPLMKNPSSVVFVSSVVVEKAFPGTAVYTASKAALEGMAGILNLELAPRGIRVNSVRPGVTLTEIQSKAGLSEDQIDALAKDMETTPIGRALKAGDISGSVAFLLSDASLAMRNTSVTVDGGVRL
ncbi:SDR family oxidoreductase [Grimontia sp. SpTr1]|uniref:SDR family NAD(P)-dependent oxidoreductase n=1 Tax=Grimontia sp. SpTr1 TaxID=2995319 RepID=UPI00248B100E|nr:SDR family oxidoreductase [Grimontia sp. SpTr1]